MDSAKELGKLNEIEGRVNAALAEGDYDEAQKALSVATRTSYEMTMKLVSEGAAPGVVLPWVVQATNSFGLAIALQANSGNVEAVAESLNRLNGILAAVDTEPIGSLETGECMHGRVTYDDNKCPRIPCI